MRALRQSGFEAALALFCLGAISACKSQAADSGPPLPSVPCADKAWSDEVCILGGVFIMGHDPLPWTPPTCPPPTGPGNNCGPGDPPPNDFTPAHEVELDPFFIDRYPATNAQYKACFDAGQCPDEVRNSYDSNFAAKVSFKAPALTSYPVQTLSPDGADAYCRWKGKRMPTEAEWERAARGPRSADYPWGNDPPDCSHFRCDTPAEPFASLRIPFWPVGSVPGDVSPEGAHEMVTNAEEFVHDLYDPTYYPRSPRHNPQGPAQNGRLFRVSRGHADIFGGPNTLIQYHGFRYPPPAWARDDFGGSVRCARDGTGNGGSEPLASFRQRVLSGVLSGAPKGGAQ